jgi:hypothetical protein
MKRSVRYGAGFAVDDKHMLCRKAFYHSSEDNIAVRLLHCGTLSPQGLD